MKKYIYDKLQSKISTIIRKNIKFEYTSTRYSRAIEGWTSDDWEFKPSREQGMMVAEKILTEIGIKPDLPDETTTD